MKKNKKQLKQKYSTITSKIINSHFYDDDLVKYITSKKKVKLLFIPIRVLKIIHNDKNIPLLMSMSQII